MIENQKLRELLDKYLKQYRQTHPRDFIDAGNWSFGDASVQLPGHVLVFLLELENRLTKLQPVPAKDTIGKSRFFCYLPWSRDPDADYEETDRQVDQELDEATIEVYGNILIRDTERAPTKNVGELCGWGFCRAWGYWVATGPGVPADRAEPFHKIWGREVRVDGSCRCPSPLERHRGFAVGTYHIDTQEGLNAFASLLRSIHKPEA